MTYYETARGAKVFAAGAFTLAGAALEPGVPRVAGEPVARIWVGRDTRYEAWLRWRGLNGSLPSD